MERLIERSEALERGAWTDLYEATEPKLRTQLGLEVSRECGATLLSARRVDHLLLNRAIGLRPAPPEASNAVDTTVAHYRQRGVTRFWVHLSADQRHTGVPAQLERAGMIRYPRSWMKFVRPLASVPLDRTGHTPRLARPEDSDRIAGILSAGFDIDPRARPLLSSTIGRPGWSYLVAELEGKVVAASALYVRGTDGYLVFAATEERARGRGFQRSLMIARIARAAKAGCTRVFTETGLPKRGEPNTSYRNMLRLGFDELCVRDNFAPIGTKWPNLPSSGVNERLTA